MNARCVPQTCLRHTTYAASKREGNRKMHPDDHPRGGGLVEQLLPLIAMSRMGNGNSTWSMVIALCLPLLISSLSVFLIQLRNRLAKVCQTGYTRTIAHTTTNQYWWTSAGDDDQGELQLAMAD